MKLFRLAGLLVIALALMTGATQTARAGASVTCWKSCSGVPYNGASLRLKEAESAAKPLAQTA